MYIGVRTAHARLSRPRTENVLAKQNIKKETNKMKRKISIAVLLILAMLVMTSCTAIQGAVDKVKQLLPHKDPQVQVDPTPDDPKPCEHSYEKKVTEPTCTAEGYTTYKCKNCGNTYTADQTAKKSHTFQNGKCSCGAEDPNYVPPCEHEWVDPTCTADGYCTKCDEPGDPATGHKDEDKNFLCDVCGIEDIPATHEKVSYTLNISDLAAGTRSADEINGVFTILSGTEVRNRTKTFEGVEYNKSVKIGNSTAKIKVSVPGTGKLSFIVQNGSSGVDMQYITVTGPDGTVHNIEFVGNSAGSPLVMIELDVTAGDWTISRGKNGGTQDVFYLALTAIVEKADESGFELVAEGKVDYLVGDVLDLSGVRLNATFSNGKTEPLATDKVDIDYSLVDFTESGTYTVTITYKNYAPITYYVNVYQPESLRLDYDYTEKLSANSQAGNGVYFNHSFKEVYLVGEELDTTGLVATVVATCDDKTLEFRVPFTVEGFDSSSPDILTLTVTAYGVSANTDVHITDTTPTPDENGVYQLLVDPAYLGIATALSGPYHVFRTIQQALDYAATIDASAQKVISIAPGYYYEKLEITVPNLKLEGFGETPDEVVIEWNSIYGIPDAGGFSQVTDSTATVAVRDSAYNVTIDNVTISNYWNSQERFTEAGLEIERGLALLVQSDRFIMTNSKLLGTQDTLELFTGRQYFENVFISGYTDFIFGTNNATIFKNCTVHMIDTLKDDKGTAGYITAFKGSNKGASDSIVYGAIFDGCKFTGDEGLTQGVHAIGRTWGAYAAVAVINCELGGHISTAGYEPSLKTARYISMNGINPTDATVQFVEFGNTGAGALTEAVAGMKMLTEAEAALYTDFATVFGTVNGNVTFLDAWDPSSEEAVVDDRTYYYFNGTEGASGTSYTYAENLQGTVTEWNGLTIDTTRGKLTSRGSDSQFNTGAKISFSVQGGTLVTVISYPGYGYYTINGVAHNANDSFSMYFAEDTVVVIEATATAYLYQIIIDPNTEAPEAPTVTEIKVEMTKEYTVGTELDLAGAVVKVYFSDHSILTVTDYTVDASAVNTGAAGSYEVIFSYGESSATVTVNYADPNAGPEIDKATVLDFTSEAGYNAVVDNSKVTLEGNFRNNGSEYQITGTIKFQVKAGTCVTVLPYSNTSYVSYTLGMEGEEDLTVYNESMSMMFFEDCTVVYTGLENNYLYQIIITVPVSEGKYVFGGSSEEGDVTGILSSTGSIEISGTFNTHSGGAQMGESSQIFFILGAGYTLTVKGYDTSYGQLEVFVDGELIEMDSNACYNFTAYDPATVLINAKNVGTEEAPDWSKSYITYIDIVKINFIEDPITVTFGSDGNYKEIEDVDCSGANLRDNGGNNSQFSGGTITFWVKAGTEIKVHGYAGYTSYTISDGNTSSEEITEAEAPSFIATVDGIITIAPVDGNNYFYSIEIIPEE